MLQPSYFILARTGGVTTTYAWDQDDKMTGLTTSDSSQSAAYIYAYNGDRLQRTLNGTAWNYLYSKEDILKIDQGGTSPMYLTQGPGIDDVLAESTAAGTNYAYKNMLSSVLQLAGSTGLVANNYNYDAWGQATNWPTPASDPNPYGYTGREWETAGSYYYRNRYYLVRSVFLTSDPVVRTAGYHYGADNPMKFMDPFGLTPCQRCDECPCGAWTLNSLPIGLTVSGAGDELEWKGELTCNCPHTIVPYPSDVILRCRIKAGIVLSLGGGFSGFHVSAACSREQLLSSSWTGSYGAWGPFEGLSGVNSEGILPTLWGGGVSVGIGGGGALVDCGIERNPNGMDWPKL
jgi:RHS repeat-associated protein